MSPNICHSHPVPFCSIDLQSYTDHYYSADVVKEDGDTPDQEVTPDYLAVLTHNGIPPHLLRLKRGCVCCLMRNLSVRKGLVKKARVVVQQLHRRFVDA
jgi:hypothetical protein